ncbi:MAG: hypothetical protein AAGE65_01560 [Planctomycetota bacterium]
MSTVLDSSPASAVPTWQPAWLSYVGSVATCMQSLGLDVDQTEVAGVSGYAFALSINHGLCPSGPTFLEWNRLSQGVSDLGRSTTTFYAQECYAGGRRNDRTRAHAREAFELARRETAAGRPCVVWGLGVPEFGVVYGVEGEDYLCVEGGPTPARVRWDAIDAPGGPFCLAFPTPRTVDSGRSARLALWRAVTLTLRPSFAANHRTQLPAYDYWVAQLRSGLAVRWSNSYNAQCWSEARRHAVEYIDRLATRLPGVAGPLRDAHVAYRVVADRLRAVATLFPWKDDRDAAVVEDRDAITLASEHLVAARNAEAQAALALRAALAALNTPN